MAEISTRDRELMHTCLTRLEIAAFNAVHAMPYPGSQAYEALGIADDPQRWRWDALVEHLLWLQQVSARTAKKYEREP